VMLSDSEHIDARALGAFMGAASAMASPEPAAVAEETDTTSYAEAMAGFEKRFLAEALRASGGRVAEAAQRIGIGRATMYKKIVALGIDV
jgi:DNA-binding NtrC family response regulator